MVHLAAVLPHPATTEEVSHFTARCYYALRWKCCRTMTVRPSVRLSVTRRYSVETAKHILRLLSPAGNLVFFRTKRYGKIPTGTPCPNRGVECRGVWI